MSSLPRVDFHVHLAPYLTEDAAAAAGVQMQEGRVSIDGHRIGPAGLYDRAGLIAHMDERGLDEAVVSPPPPFFRQDLDEAACARWARTLNAGMLAATDAAERLPVLGYLPLEHPEIAIAEHGRLCREDGWVGFCASAGGRSRSLADPALEPLWQALDGEEALLLLHPGESRDERLAEFYLHNLLGNPVETAVAAAQMVFGDVLARYPRVRVLLVHCGGCVPDLVARWDHGVETSRPGLRELSERPSQAVRRFWIDCLVHDPAAVDRAIEVFGPDHLLLGSDWPFPMGTSDPAALIAHRGEAFVETVAAVNAAAALGR